MFVNMQYQSCIIMFVFSFIFLNNSVKSQNLAGESKLKINVQYVLDGNELPNITREIGAYFVETLKSKNVLIADDAFYELALSVKELSENNEIIISITENMALPDYIVNLNVEHESFYKDVSDKTKFPPEGKEIRKMITREFMYKYREAMDNHIIITNKTDWKKYCNEYFNAFISKITKYQKRS